MSFAQNSFELSAVDNFGNPVIIFNMPITVTVNYTDTDFTGPEDTLGLYYWDNIASSWTDVATTCPGGYTRNLSANWFSLPLCHLTEFGVFSLPIYNFLPLVRR
jgi:hypothetical protein